jgi:hypothetical protein
MVLLMVLLAVKYYQLFPAFGEEACSDPVRALTDWINYQDKFPQKPDQL